MLVGVLVGKLVHKKPGVTIAAPKPVIPPK